MREGERGGTGQRQRGRERRVGGENHEAVYRPANPQGFTVCLTNLLVVSQSHGLAAQTHGFICLVMHMHPCTGTISQSTVELCIGMDEVMPVHLKIPICTFTFSDNPLLTPQDDS